jgi:LytR cell envelope-related transcriptional attenuator
MLHLRDHGFDVVELGTTTATRDSTLVLDRSHHPEWAQRVARSLGGARVESRPDTSRYLDVTVLLGGNWRAPSQTFHP